MLPNGLVMIYTNASGQPTLAAYDWNTGTVYPTASTPSTLIDVAPSGWDSDSICYGHVFRWKSELYMVYCGNHYGRNGLGLARWVDEPLS